MNEFIRYLLMSSACIVALYLVYKAFLRRDTFFMMNRIYLLAAVMLSTTLPLVPIRFSFGGALAMATVWLQPVLITPNSISAATQGHLEWAGIAALIYFTGVAIFGVRFLVQLIQLWLLVRRCGISRREGLNLVLTDRGYSPFSFFSLVFIKGDHLEDERLAAVIEHERVHIRQYHSADLILTELLTIVQWFNPFAWLLQRSVKAVHEYLADEGVLRRGIPGDHYRRLIFDQALGIQVNNLTNNFNVSLLKKRIAMMTRSRSARMAGIKAVLALPALFAVLFFFSAGSLDSLSAQEKTTTAKQAEKTTPAPAPAGQEKVYERVDNEPTYPGGMDALIQFLVKNIKYPEQAKKDSVTGKVITTFIVETDGSVTNVKVIRGIGHGCDEEAVRVVSMMPRWNPGSLSDGKKVRVQFNLPIQFALNGKKK
jgi:TonB family protein